MTISDSSSAASISPSAKPRKVVRLTGPSVAIDPHDRAVRRDLAEYDLADTVFAQHYAIPLAMRATRLTAILAEPREDAVPVAELAAGATFHVLDIGGAWAWGRSDRAGSVGYVHADALTQP